MKVMMVGILQESQHKGVMKRC